MNSRVDISDFRFDFSPSDVQQILGRVRSFPWNDIPSIPGWGGGIDVELLREFCHYWTNEFDWFAAQERLNRAGRHCIAQVGETKVHFAHARPDETPGVPIVLIHGWPGSFVDYVKLLTSLSSKPSAHEVVALSLPGFAPSPAPSSLLGPADIADAVDRLMVDGLGHQRYAVHGADWGSVIALYAADRHPQTCAGAHVTMTSPRMFARHVETDAEREWLKTMGANMDRDGAYFRLQSTTPQTLGLLLADSPVGYAGWVLERLARWADTRAGTGTYSPSKLFDVAGKDSLASGIMLQLLGGSAASGLWIYKAAAESTAQIEKFIEVPIAVGRFADPAFPVAPESVLKRACNVVQWTDHQQGGHFPALEVPDLLETDLRQFLTKL